MHLFNKLFGGKAKQKPRRASFCVPRLEHLEERSLLSGGNVTATSIGLSRLRLDGDASDNSIVITKDPASTKILVQAIDGTQLNGVVNGSDVFRASSSLALYMKDGNDYVRIDVVGLSPGLVLVDLGAGQNFLRVDHLDVRNSFTILGGRDADQIELANVTVFHALAINTGSGNDALYLGLYRDPELGFGNLSVGTLTVYTSDGDDSVLLGNLSVRGDASFDLGGGNDQLAVNLSINQQKTLSGAIDVGGQLTIDTGVTDRDLGQDSVQLNAAPLQIVGKTVIRTGGGDDAVYVAGVTNETAQLGDLTIDVGAGNDAVGVDALNGAALDLNVGDGDNQVVLGAISSEETVALSRVVFRGAAHVAAGAGSDRYFIRNVHFGSTFDLFDGAGNGQGQHSINTIDIEAAIFQGTATFRMGSGQDLFYIERTMPHGFFDPLGVTVFYGRVLFDLGGGDDRIFLSAYRDTTHTVTFRGLVIYNGGDGMDLIYGYSPYGSVRYLGGREQHSCAVLDCLP